MLGALVFALVAVVYVSGVMVLVGAGLELRRIDRALRKTDAELWAARKQIEWLMWMVRKAR